MLFTLMMAILSNLSSVRETYKLAYESSDKADELVQLTKDNTTDAVMQAYYGSGLAFQANHSWNPATKLSKASDGYKQLNAAVAKASSNFEVRFLRFSFESKAPSFLGYTEHLAEDKTWLLSHLDKSHPMWSVIKSFLKDCDKLTAEEKKKL